MFKKIMCVCLSAFLLFGAVFSHCDIYSAQEGIAAEDNLSAGDSYDYSFDGSITTNLFNLTRGTWNHFANVYNFDGSFGAVLYADSFDHEDPNFRISTYFDSGEVMANKGNSFFFETDFCLTAQSLGNAVDSSFYSGEVWYCNPEGEWKILCVPRLAGTGHINVTASKSMLPEDVRMIVVHLYANLHSVFEGGSLINIVCDNILFVNPSYVSVYGTIEPASDSLVDIGNEQIIVSNNIFENVVNIVKTLINLPSNIFKSLKVLFTVLPSATFSFFEEILSDIKDAVTGIGTVFKTALEVVFLPDEDYMNTRIESLTERFAFAKSVSDTIVRIVNLFESYSGSSPPILTANVDLYGENVDVTYLDMSWYAPYKKYGDAVLSGIMFVGFAWGVYARLPGIINGASALGVTVEKTSKED